MWAGLVINWENYQEMLFFANESWKKGHNLTEKKWAGLKLRAIFDVFILFLGV